jgi:hypothetical protein
MALENLLVWTITPDWSQDLTETLEWLTSILASPIGAEQRFSVRETPRRSFEMTFKPHGPIRTLFDLFMERAGGVDIYLPLWHDSNKLTVAANIGGSSLNVASLAYTEFKNCPAIFIQGANPFTYELTEYFSETGNTITTNVVLENDWPVGTRIFPAMKVHIEGAVTATRKADEAFQVRVKFSSHVPNPMTDTIALTIINDQPVLEREPNDVSDLTVEYSRLLSELDNQSGLKRRKDLNEWGVTVQQFTFLLKKRADHSWVRSLFYQLEGRKKPLFIPTFFNDLEPTEPLDTATITVKRCGYTDFAGPFRGRQMIRIHLRDGTSVYRKILSSAIIGDGSLEAITVDAAFVPIIPIAAIHRISFMAVGRLDSDSIEIVHHTDTHGASTCTTNFRTIPQVRNPIPDPDNEDDSETGFTVPPDLFYFEVEATMAGGESTILVGVADSSFNLDRPQALDVSPGSYTTLNGGVFMAIAGTGTNPTGWSGDPGGAPGFAGIGTTTLGDKIGVLFSKSSGLVWWRNATLDPNTWRGGALSPPPDPETLTGGWPIANGTISGNIFALVGLRYENFGSPPQPFATVNFGATAFAAALPAGAVAWGASVTLNPADCSADLLLSGGDLTVTAPTFIPGANGPASFCRSTASV